MTRSKSNASDPFAMALRLLTGRDRSTAELRQRLSEAGFPAEAVEDALQRCRSCHYLDDRRYARERARTLLRSGRGSGRKILYDLRQRGIPEAEAAEALARAEEEYPPEQMLREQLQRRFPGFTWNGADDRERRRVIAYFQRRGFPLGEILNLLQNRTDPAAD